MKRSRRKLFSAALILAGCVCIAVLVFIEARDYPFSPGVEEKMSDPPPPDFDVVGYEEYIQEMINSPAADGTPAFLPDPGDPAEESPAPAQPRYVLLGTIKIPRIDISENLFEGTENQMRYGVGHLEGSPMPGEKGNVVLSAHRVSTVGKYPFRHLDKMQDGDRIVIKLGEETFAYEVYDQFIVHETDLWVLKSVKEETHVLTLVTCDPAGGYGRREDRLIVRAKLTDG
ncbi:MAG: class D sortase [Oscillospiraceae bacterium]|nr:class D sortase [Oscillospiraceae bacterium]